MLICMPIKTLLLYLAATHSLAVQKFIFHYSLDKAKPTLSSLDIVHHSHMKLFQNCQN